MYRRNSPSIQTSTAVSLTPKFTFLGGFKLLSADQEGFERMRRDLEDSYDEEYELKLKILLSNPDQRNSLNMSKSSICVASAESISENYFDYSMS